MVTKIKIKVGKHQLSPNSRYMIFGRKKVLDGIQGSYRLSIGLAPIAAPLVEGPFYGKSTWQRLKELIKR